MKLEVKDERQRDKVQKIKAEMCKVRVRKTKYMQCKLSTYFYFIVAIIL